MILETFKEPAAAMAARQHVFLSACQLGRTRVTTQNSAPARGGRWTPTAIHPDTDTVGGSPHRLLRGYRTVPEANQIGSWIFCNT